MQAILKLLITAFEYSYFLNTLVIYCKSFWVVKLVLNTVIFFTPASVILHRRSSCWDEHSLLPVLLQYVYPSSVVHFLLQYLYRKAALVGNLTVFSWHLLIDCLRQLNLITTSVGIMSCLRSIVRQMWPIYAPRTTELSSTMYFCVISTRLL